MVESLGTVNYAMEQGYQKSFSEKTGALIDAEVKKIINSQYVECRAVLEANKDKIESLAQKLLEKETLSLPDIVDILGQRPFPLKKNVLDYLHELRERDTKESTEEKVEVKPENDASHSEEEDQNKEDAAETPETKSTKDKTSN